MFKDSDVSFNSLHDLDVSNYQFCLAFFCFMRLLFSISRILDSGYTFHLIDLHLYAIQKK